MTCLLRHCLVLAAAIAATAVIHAAEPHISREAIEWCNIWIPDANDTTLPRVLLIGDSITGGYRARRRVTENPRLIGLGSTAAIRCAAAACRRPWLACSGRGHPDG